MTPPASGFRALGAGHLITFCCARCAKYRERRGSKVQMVGGIKRAVCKDCVRPKP